jgi:hypothetical protein
VRQRPAVPIYYHSAIVWVVLIFCMPSLHAQTDSASSLYQSLNKISSKSFFSLDKQYAVLEKIIERKTEKALRRMQQKEARLQKDLQSKDSLKAQQLFADSKQKYQQLEAGIKEPVTGEVQPGYTNYIAGLDSMRTSLNFIMQQGTKMPSLPSDKLQQLQMLADQLKTLQAKLQNANDAEVFIKQREQQLKDQLTQYGLGKQLLGLNKEAYYFQQDLAQYKDILSNKQKLQETILSIARKFPAFQRFWQKYSLLAQLFPMPANYGTAAALDGLQTNAMITTLIQQRLGSSGSAAGGMNAGSPIPQQYLTNAQGQLDGIKDKASNAGATNSNTTVPDFKPDQQHGKSVWRRLTYGFNMQTQAATSLLPAITDIGVQLGLKVSDQIQIGIGGSYKVGTGTLKCMHLSNEGVSTRSYLDIRAKGSIWITGAWEDNYMQSFKSLQDLHSNVTAWQKSALLGLTKKYSVGKREGNMQLLYDFMAGQVVPRSNPLKFRVGYSF